MRMQDGNRSVRKGREYWLGLVSEFEAAPCRHDEFAARHGYILARARREKVVDVSDVAVHDSRRVEAKVSGRAVAGVAAVSA